MRPIVMFMAVLAILGAALSTSIMPEYRFVAFSLWCISNCYLLRDFFLRKEYAWVVVYIVYEIFNVIGVINNYKVI